MKYAVTWHSRSLSGRNEFSTRKGAESFQKFKHQCGFAATLEPINADAML